jgi:hypothetical protein
MSPGALACIPPDISQRPPLGRPLAGRSGARFRPCDPTLRPGLAGQYAPCVLQTTGAGVRKLGADAAQADDDSGYHPGDIVSRLLTLQKGAIRPALVAELVVRWCGGAVGKRGLGR